MATATRATGFHHSPLTAILVIIGGAWTLVLLAYLLSLGLGHV